MDLLSQHEAFLRAIFDAPGDDTPRLVYADFLQENGEEEVARFIRLSCDVHRWEMEDYRRHVPAHLTLTEALAVPQWEPDPHLLSLQEALTGLIKESAHKLLWSGSCPRGFPVRPDEVHVQVTVLDDGIQLREEIVRCNPEWNGTGAVKVISRRLVRPELLTADRVETLLSLSAFQRVAKWDLSGCSEMQVTGIAGSAGDGVFDEYPYTSLIEYTMMTGAGVQSLARARESGRIATLDLRHNELDDDAAESLVNSPYLNNLKRLRLREGNRFGEQVWQQVIERFGADVVE